MSRPSAARTLAQLEEGLEALISGLESQPLPSAEVLDSIWRRVQQGFEVLEAELAGNGPFLAQHREPLERCQRLHVLATGLSARRRAEVALERKTCGGLRARLRAVRREDERGGSCDVSA